MQYCTYRSSVLNGWRPLVVYTPADYETSGKSYPVFYLVSGTTDTEETWYKVGKLNTILDNLIADGKAEPMIVVMPYGNMGATPMPSSMAATKLYDVFVREMTECVMPYVEKSFRTVNDRDHRAIAGFSRGGGQSLYTALSHPELFAWLASYSAYLTPEMMDHARDDGHLLPAVRRESFPHQRSVQARLVRRRLLRLPVPGGRGKP